MNRETLTTLANAALAKTDELVRMLAQVDRVIESQTPEHNTGDPADMDLREKLGAINYRLDGLLVRAARILRNV